tara:strand:- start:250 stop:462 length:213 start_codon:yes stop_codon:yes gene_type:complete
MIIRDEIIIEAQKELDELIKFRNTYMMRKYDEEYNEYPAKKGDNLLRRTINLKRKALCELYIDKMKRYLE